MADTPKPMQGTWTLTAPDGRTWQGEAPLRVVAAEQRERVPPEVALQRLYDAADEPTEVEKVLTSALQQIADMDPAGQRADDLGRAARIARTSVAPGVSLVGLGQGESFVTRLGDIDQRIPVSAAGTQEVDASLVNLGGHGLEHDRKAAVPTGPHGADATPGAASVDEADDASFELGKLLNRIHGDHGQYLQQHGWKKAATDALSKVQSND